MLICAELHFIPLVAESKKYLIANWGYFVAQVAKNPQILITFCYFSSKLHKKRKKLSAEAGRKAEFTSQRDYV
jgi:hypothetical protein